MKETNFMNNINLEITRNAAFEDYFFIEIR